MNSLFPRLVALGLSFLATATAATESATRTFVSAAEQAFLYEGRFDSSDPTGPIVVWQGSRIRVDFEGHHVGLEFADVKGQAVFDVMIDGRASVLELREETTPRGTTFLASGGGRHSLVLFKRSEAAAGTARFRGIGLGAGAKAFAPRRPNYTMRTLFIGDSITAGACNEDGAEDQWDDRSTHNNARSYGAFTAAALSADYRNIAVSGMGIAAGWVEMRAGDVWNRVYPDPASARADLTDWLPHLVFVNLGENDDSFTNAKGRPFPENYTSGYVDLVQAIRRAYPAAEIVLLRGGMFGGAKSERLREPWEAAVQRLTQSDPNVHRFVFAHWSSNHPRVADHRAMADELLAWLRAQPFMKAFE